MCVGKITHPLSPLLTSTPMVSVKGKVIAIFFFQLLPFGLDTESHSDP